VKAMDVALALVGVLAVGAIGKAVVDARQQPERFPATNRCLINGRWQACPPAEAPPAAQEDFLWRRKITGGDTSIITRDKVGVLLHLKTGTCWVTTYEGIAPAPREVCQ
jgi:hypothetical protein